MKILSKKIKFYEDLKKIMRNYLHLKNRKAVNL